MSNKLARNAPDLQQLLLFPASTKAEVKNTQNKRSYRRCPLFTKPVEIDPPVVHGDWSVFRKLSKEHWLARCVCGIEKGVVSYALTYGRSTGCGCRAIKRAAEAYKPKLAGRTFGSWSVIEEGLLRGNGNQVQWLCRCACGTLRLVHTASLMQGKSKSCGCAKSVGHGEYAIRTTLRHYEDGATRRGHGWKLSRPQAMELFAGPCHFCGLPPSNVCRKSSGSFTYSGIDRLNNLQGYELQNCVSCCVTCNKAKRTLTEEQFRAWISRLVRHGRVLCIPSEVAVDAKQERRHAGLGPGMPREE
jgi:hypothetical protein